MPPIDLVLLDLDDTLLDHRSSVELGFRDHVSAGEHRVDDVDGAAARWHELEHEHYARYLSGELDYQGQRRARAQALLAEFGSGLGDDEADEWFRVYFDRTRERWALFDDAAAALDALDAAGVRTGVITNGDPVAQHDKLERLGLTGRFEHVVCSGAEGVSKPDPAIFRAALDRFGVAAERAAYIGDRLLTDAIGAADAGLLGVWLHRHGDDLPEASIGHGGGAAPADVAAARALAADRGAVVVGGLDEIVGAIGRG